MAALDEHAFRVAADRALGQAERTLSALADREGFDIDRHNGVMHISFEKPRPAKFVVNPHAPARQVWVSAASRSYRLSWSAEAAAFAVDGETLEALLGRLALEHLGGSMR